MRDQKRGGREKKARVMENGEKIYAGIRFSGIEVESCIFAEMFCRHSWREEEGTKYQAIRKAKERR